MKTKTKDRIYVWSAIIIALILVIVLICFLNTIIENKDTDLERICSNHNGFYFKQVNSRLLQCVDSEGNMEYIQMRPSSFGHIQEVIWNETNFKNNENRN